MSLKEEIVLAISRQPSLLAQEIAFDIVFVMHVSARGWILEKICRQIAEASGRTYTFVYSERNDRITAPIPRARAYFFAHYAIYVFALARHPELHAASLFVWFTHPDFGKGISIDDLVFALKQADVIFTANAQHGSALEVLGIPRQAVRTIYGGADPESFRPKIRGNGKVGFVGAYYERKQPAKMLEVIRTMPDVQFLLLGPSPDSVENKGLLWSNYIRFSELRALSNLEIVEAAYDQYPSHFERIDVYVCLSQMEGGPIPLVEALMANAVPVVTRTGFCEELVQQDENGFLLDIDAEVPEIVGAIRKALTFEADVSVGAQNLSWTSFGAGIAREMQMPLNGRFSLSFGRIERNSRRYLREGWDVPESAGTWQFAKRAQIQLPLKLNHALSSLRIMFRSGSVFGDVVKIEVHIHLNGQLLAKEKVRQNRQCEISISEVPPIISQPVNKLVIEVLTSAQISAEEPSRLIRLEQLEGETVLVSEIEPTLARHLSRPGVIRRKISTTVKERVKEEVVPTVFDFSTMGGKLDLPAAGWHDAELGGMWSSDTEAYVLLPLSQTLAGCAEVIVTGRIYEPMLARNQQLVINLSNGEAEETFNFVVDSGEIQQFIMLFARTSHSRVVRVRFSLPQIFSPFDLGTDQEDRRKLGFMLNQIEFRVSSVKDQSALPAETTPITSKADVLPKSILIGE